MNTFTHWNAVYTRANYEKKVSRLLEKKGIVHYWPQNQVLLDSTEPKKFMAAALFPSIIFVQPTEQTPLSYITQLSHINNPVYWQNQPAVFPAAEIESLRNFMEAHETVQVIKTGLCVNGDLPQQTANQQYSATDQIHIIHLPSLGYSLSAKMELVTTVRLVRKNTPAYRITDSLAFFLGFKSAGNKLQ